MKLFGGLHGTRSRGGRAKAQPGAEGRDLPLPEEAASPQPEPDETVPFRPVKEDERRKPLPEEHAQPLREPEKTVPLRSSAEEAEIEEIIAAYQKKKRRRRFIILAVLAILVAGGVVLWRTLVRPPEIVQPTAKPTPAAALPTATPGQDEPEETQAPEETPPPERMRRENVYTFLLVGRDQGGGNTDTLMVGIFDTNAGTVDVVSIPRDTCANVDSDPNKGELKKISGVYARADYDGLKDAISDITGFPIDCYVSVGVNGFILLVNTIGGVTFNIPHNMNYDDPTQNLHIHFNAGEQFINGYDAIKVVRWRQNNDGTNYGDIDRIQTQQNFLKTVLKQCLSLSNLVTNLDDYIKIFQDNVKTDLTTGNMTWFAKEILKLDMENVHFYTVPSNYSDMINGFSYGTILVDEWLEMLNEHLNVYDQPITLEDLDLISRDENGKLYATSGEIRGGMESFLTMEQYMRMLREWQSSLAPAQTAEPVSAPAQEEQTPETGGEEAQPAETNGGE